jgi:acetoin utilization deacetylase AcuC-like enzyme
LSVALITHPACLEHDTGTWHPETADRLRYVLRALEGEAFLPLLREQAPRATEEELTRVHPADYVRAILAIRPEPGEHVPLDADTIMSAGSAEAALRAAGGSPRGRRATTPKPAAAWVSVFFQMPQSRPAMRRRRD